MTLKNILISATFALCLSTAHAELTASHQAAVEKLLVVMQVQKQFENNLILGFESGLGANSEQIKSMPQEQQQKFAAGIEKVKAAMMQEMGWEKLKPEVVAIYGKAFSEQEAKDAAALMDSPAGQLVIGKQVGMASDMFKIAQDKMKLLMPQIMQIMQAEMTK